MRRRMLRHMVLAVAGAGALGVAASARASLTYSLEVDGTGAHDATMAGNSDVTVAIYASMTDAGRPGFLIGGGSLLATGSAGSGQVMNVTLASGLDGGGSALGVSADLNGDGFLDWGTNDQSSGTDFFYAASNLATPGAPIEGAKVKLGTFTFHTGTFVSGQSVSLSFVPRDRTGASDHFWYENYDPTATGTTPKYNALDETLGTMQVGMGVTIDAATPGEWGNVTSGDFSNGANWTGGVAPIAVDTAKFLQMPTATASVRLTAPATVQGVTFDNSHGYTVYTDNASKLTISHAGGASVNVLSGQHEISAPLALTDNTTFDIAGGSQLTVSGPIDPAAVTITKSGTGALAVSRLQNQTLDMGAGSVRLLANGADANVTVLEGLTAAAGTTLDLSNNDAIVRNGDLATIAALIASGYDSGAWDGTGIIASAAPGIPGARIGYARAGDLGLTSFDGVAVAADDILLKFTWGGDANLDGIVNIGDLTLLGGHYKANTIRWSDGNFNYDNVVDIGDLTILGSNYKKAAILPDTVGPQVDMVAAPEPGSLALLLIAASPLLARRKTWGK